MRVQGTAFFALAVAAVAGLAGPAAGPVAAAAVVHDTQSEFAPGAFHQTVLQGTEEAPEIRLGTYLQSSWTFQDEDIAGWTYAAQPAGNYAAEDPAGQIHLRALYATAEAYGLASRGDVAVPLQCIVEWRVYLDAIAPANVGGTYNQPRGACCRLDVQRANGGLRMDIFTDRMVSFYRNGTAGYDYPTLTSVDIATETGRWYTYRAVCDFNAMTAQVYRDGDYVGQFLADSRNSAGNTLRMLAYSRVSVSGQAEFHVDSVRLGTEVAVSYATGTYTSDVLTLDAGALGPLAWDAVPADPYPWGPWVKSATNPVLAATCLNENLLCDVNDPLQQPLLYDGKYWMSYADATHIRLAWTMDPALATWTPYAGNPILSPVAGEAYVYSPHLFLDGDTWYLFFDVSLSADGRQRVAYATAPAPTGPWTRGQIVLDRGAAGEWDDYRVTEPYVFRDGDTYFLYYMGDHVCSGCNEQVGLATTTAALFPLGPEPGGLWTKHGLVLPHNPSPTGWDRGLTADPSIIKVGSTFFMRYTGSYANEHWQLGTAWATNPYGPWQRPAAPDIALGPAGSWDDDRLVRGAIHYHDGRYYSPYTGNDGGAYRGGIASADAVTPDEYLAFETRTSHDGATWEEWRAVGAGGAVASTPDMYFQYRVGLTTAPAGGSPTLTRVSLDYEPYVPPENIVCDPVPLNLNVASPSGPVTVRYLGGGSGPVYGFSIDVLWDPAVVGATVVRPLTGPFAATRIFMTIPIAAGGLTGLRVDAALEGATPGIVSGDLFRVEFTHAGIPYGVSVVDLTPVEFRDGVNQPLSGFLAADGQVVVDGAPPAVTGVLIENLTLAHTDDYIKNGDAARVTATVTDAAPGFGAGAISADLSALGGGAAVPPESWIGGVAVWNLAAVTCTPADGPATVVVSATDPFGNTGSGSDAIIADNTPPAALAGLTAAPSHNQVHLAWTSAYSGDPRAYRGVLVRYARWTGYPVYAPAPPAYPAGPGAGDGTAFDGIGDIAAGTHALTNDDRDIYAYSGFVYDEALNFSADATTHDAMATSYWLGDVCGITAGDEAYNGLVGVADVNVMGAAYGAFPLAWPLNEADVGPTDDMSRVGIPTTDGVVDFEDLMIFSMNFGVVARAPLAAAPAGALTLSWSRVDERTWALGLEAPYPTLQGVNVAAELPGGAVAEVVAGALAAAQTAPVFLRNIDSRGLDAGLAVLGAGEGFAGQGELLRITLPAGVTPENVRLRARDVENAELHDTSGLTERPPVPTAFALAPNVPNPFNPSTRIAYALPADAEVRLAVYAVDGSRVRTLVDGPRPAGRHEAEWDGRDDTGRPVASGAYFCRIEAGAFRQTRKMTLMK